MGRLKASQRRGIPAFTRRSVFGIHNEGKPQVLHLVADFILKRGRLLTRNVVSPENQRKLRRMERPLASGHDVGEVARVHVAVRPETGNVPQSSLVVRRAPEQVVGHHIGAVGWWGFRAAAEVPFIPGRTDDRGPLGDLSVQGALCIVGKLGSLVNDNVERQIAGLAEILLDVPERNLPQACQLIILAPECGRQRREAGVCRVGASDGDER